MNTEYSPSQLMNFAERGMLAKREMADLLPEEPRDALRGIDLDLFQSEFVVILGPSGSGKSTLLNTFWKGAAGILLWPVYLGSAFSPLVDAMAKRGSP
jgi:ABC-type transport system involved in cytochrome bd biosynthesis fused ATPase/permease subunit